MKTRRIPRLLYLWPVPAGLAVVMWCVGLFVLLRPDWPVGDLMLDSPNPIEAPFSGQLVCGYHVCVTHPGGSTCLGNRQWAEPIEYTAPDGSKGTAELRSFGVEPLFEVYQGESVTAFGEHPFETDNDRVTKRCADAECTWTEKLVRCGQMFPARWHQDDGVVYVEHAVPGLEGITAAWMIAILTVVLFLISGFMLLLFVFVRRDVE